MSIAKKILELESQGKNIYEVAGELKRIGYSPTYSSGICEQITAGYGGSDMYGYFHYPLYVNQKTLETEEFIE